MWIVGNFMDFGVWGFPACPIHLHEECACIYGRRDWGVGGLHDPGLTGVQMYFINCNKLYKRLLPV